MAALYLYKSIIRPSIEYYCHVWDSTSSFYLDMLDNLQKRVSKKFGSLLAASLQSLAIRRNIARLSLI